jgi:NTP pyrophosphatase (non-canonical NTP hydrolase)
VPPEPDAPEAFDPRTLAGFQRQIERLYGDRDAARGTSKTFVWFVEEVGELARALQGNDPQNLREEFADVLAWLTTLASLEGVDLAEAATRYAECCPACRAAPCACPRKSSQRKSG